LTVDELVGLGVVAVAGHALHPERRASGILRKSCIAHTLRRGRRGDLDLGLWPAADDGIHRTSTNWRMFAPPCTTSRLRSRGVHANAGREHRLEAVQSLVSMQRKYRPSASDLLDRFVEGVHQGLQAWASRRCGTAHPFHRRRTAPTRRRTRRRGRGGAASAAISSGGRCDRAATLNAPISGPPSGGRALPAAAASGSLGATALRVMPAPAQSAVGA
jgi:hypothetical protein